MNAWIFFALGLYHGVNPAMGWLLATSVGIQKESRKAMFYALIALTFGHAAAIGAVIFGIGWLKLYIPLEWIRYFTIILLFIVGIYHLYRHWHPKWMSLQVGNPQIFLWSFLIATAHGAGLMLIPFLIGGRKGGWFILGTHTLGYVIACFSASFFLFETLRVSLLKKTWINFDLIWAGSLILTGLFFSFQTFFR